MSLERLIQSKEFLQLSLLHIHSSCFRIFLFLLHKASLGIHHISISKQEMAAQFQVTGEQIQESLMQLGYHGIIEVTDISGINLQISIITTTERWKHLGADNPIVAVSSDTIPFPTKESIPTPLIRDLDKTKEKGNVEELGVFRKQKKKWNEVIWKLAKEKLESLKKKNESRNADEELMLNILSQHKNARKQLALAIQSSNLYPNLQEFLKELGQQVELDKH